MKRIILHTGVPKTGSTAIQLYFLNNRDALQKQGVGYYKPLYNYDPWITYSNAHFIWAVALNKLGWPDDEVKRRWLENNPSMNICMLRLDNEKRSNLQLETKNFTDYASKYDTIVLSEEMIWHYAIFYHDYWQVIRDYLRECCGDDVQIDVVTYLRRQDRWALSWWKEIMTHEIPMAMDFNDILIEFEKLGYFDYCSILEEMEKSFNKKDIHIRSAERTDLIGANIITDFMESFLPGVNKSELKTDDNFRSINVSNSVLVSNAMLWVNKIRRHEGNQRYYMVVKILDRVYKLLGLKSCRCKYPEMEIDIKHYFERFMKRNEEMYDKYNDGVAIFDTKLDEGDCLKNNLLRDRFNGALILGGEVVYRILQKVKRKCEGLINKKK